MIQQSHTGRSSSTLSIFESVDQWRRAQNKFIDSQCDMHLQSTTSNQTRRCKDIPIHQTCCFTQTIKRMGILTIIWSSKQIRRCQSFCTHDQSGTPYSLHKHHPWTQNKPVIIRPLLFFDSLYVRSQYVSALQNTNMTNVKQWTFLIDKTTIFLRLSSVDIRALSGNRRRHLNWDTIVHPTSFQAISKPQNPPPNSCCSSYFVRPLTRLHLLIIVKRPSLVTLLRCEYYVLDWLPHWSSLIPIAELIISNGISTRNTHFVECSV